MYLQKRKINCGVPPSPFLGEGLGLRSFILVFILSIFSSCGDFKEVTFTGIDNVKILNLSQQGVEAEVTAKIKNPNTASMIPTVFGFISTKYRFCQTDITGISA